MVQFLNHSKFSFFFVGDYIIDLSKQNSDRKVKNYLNDLYAPRCYSLINKPTKMTSTLSTTLDHIYSNAIDKFCISGILTYDISDHLPIFCIIKNKTYRNISNKFIQDMKHFDAEEFCVDFNARLGKLKAINSPDLSMDQFIQPLTYVTNKHVPLPKKLRR